VPPFTWTQESLQKAGACYHLPASAQGLPWARPCAGGLEWPVSNGMLAQIAPTDGSGGNGGGVAAGFPNLGPGAAGGWRNKQQSPADGQALNNDPTHLQR
jgi:hypothetical protein